MNYKLASLALCLSTTYASASSAAQGLEVGGFNVLEVVKFLPFFAIFYYFLIHQPKKNAREHQKKIEALRKGDKIVTTGGILGLIHKIDEASTEATIEIADNIRIQVLKSTISPLQINAPQAASK